MRTLPLCMLHAFQVPIIFSLLLSALVSSFFLRKRPIRWILLFVIATVIVLLSLSTTWFLWGRYVPAEYALLFRNPVSGIKYIRINPAPYFSLVDHEVVITNTATIEDIMAAIRSSKAYSPNHPTTHWECWLEIVDESGQSYVDVVDTDGQFPQGVIIFCITSADGVIFDTLQSSEFGNILGKATGQK
jgi:hypothetical protein